MAILPALLLLFAASALSDLEVEVKRFAGVYSVVEQNAADPVNPSVAFYSGAIPGLLRRLDPYSVFFNPDQFRQLEELGKSTQIGFGTVVSVMPGRVIVLQTLPGAPSARSGMGPGDEILAVNNIRLDLLDQEQLIGLLDQSRRREVTLIVRRAGGSSLLQIHMSPEEVDAPSVDLLFFLKAGVGYIRIKSFEAETGTLLRDAIEKLGGEHLKALVLDLRDNTGGLVPSALDTASLFLPPETKLVSIRGREKELEEINVPETARNYKFPVAVLINEGTASASEIVAGALQDNNRGVIVGTPSYGKGLVQGVFPLSQGTGLALTTAFYYTPSGRSIQKPLEGGQLEGAAKKERERVASSKPSTQGGGIHPDHAVYPAPQSRLHIVLEASASFTSFATQVLPKIAPVEEDFEITAALLDEFQTYLALRSIQPGVAEWSLDREWLSSRLKQEILNQALGVDKGDEVQIQRDPQVLKALDVLTLIGGN